MRKIRNAALAGLTAMTLVAGINGVALADTDTPGAGTTTTDAPETEAPGYDTPAGDREKDPNKHAPECTFNLDLTKVDTFEKSCQTNDLFDDVKGAVKNPKATSSIFGKRYNGDKDVIGTDLLGTTKNFAAQPTWAKIWYVVTVLGVIGTVIGIGWLPIMNQLKAQGVII